MTRAAAPHLDDRETAAAVRRVFDDAGYDAERIQERLGTSDRSLAEGPDLPVYLRRLGEADPLSVLLRVVLLDTPVAAADAERLLGRHSLGLLERAGLLERNEDGLVDGTVRVVPHEHLLIASDRFSAGHADHVAAVHGPSATLAHLTVRRPVARALDVGTGNGIQSLLAAVHAERVVATDVNQRALSFGAFNAALNGIDNVEFRHGSFFEPVAGEHFDLVIANPPYVISPESSLLFRDSGLPKDAVSEQVVRTLPAHLAEGGYGSVMVSWVQESDDATARPAAWVEGSGCDALLLHTGSDEPLRIAAQWNRDLRSDAEAYAAAIDRWLEYFAAEGIEQIAFGCVVLRRRTATAERPNWVRATRMPTLRLEPSGAQLEQIFARARLPRGPRGRPSTARRAAGRRRQRGPRAGAAAGSDRLGAARGEPGDHEWDALLGRPGRRHDRPRPRPRRNEVGRRRASPAERAAKPGRARRDRRARRPPHARARVPAPRLNRPREPLTIGRGSVRESRGIRGEDG